MPRDTGGYPDRCDPAREDREDPIALSMNVYHGVLIFSQYKNLELPQGEGLSLMPTPALCAAAVVVGCGTSLAVSSPLGPALNALPPPGAARDPEPEAPPMMKSTAILARTALLGAIFAVPVGCVVAPVHSDNGIAIDPVTGACTADPYKPGQYKTGDQVQNAGKLYQCTVGGWCSIGGPYEPGVGWAWQQAWTETATCGGGSSGGSPGAGSGSGSPGSGSGSGTSGGSSGGSGTGSSSGGGSFTQSFSTWYCGNSCGGNDLSSCGLSYCENTIDTTVLGAALSIKRMNGPSGVWKGGGLCGKHVEIVVQATGQSITVPVLDACQACDADDHVDLTWAVWDKLGINTCDGRFAQKWRFVD